MPDAKQQYLYVLRPIPPLLNSDNWTQKDEEIVGRHFAALQGLLKEGRLILAGKTGGLDEKTFGLVVFEAENEAAARATMENDPAVSEGIMTAELFPYNVALMRGQNG